MSTGVDSFLDAAGKTLEVFPKLYDDGLQPAIQETGKILARIPQAINAAFSSLDIWIANKDYNVAETKVLLTKKLENVEPEKIVPPEPYVAVPAIQAISYSMNSEELRNMYANLLANSMNSDTKDSVHPSFVEIIKQLSPFDATLLNLLSCKNIDTSHPIVKIRFSLPKKSAEGIDLKKHIVDPSLGISLNNSDKYAISIDNLIRLHLIEVDYTRQIADLSDYSGIVNSEIIEVIKTVKHPKYTSCIKINGVLTISDLGKSFINICVI